MRPVQKFSDEYLAQCKKLKAEHILQFLEDFRRLHLTKGSEGSQLISIKIPRSLLSVFRQKAESLNVPYQTQIKRLMRGWVDE